MRSDAHLLLARADQNAELRLRNFPLPVIGGPSSPPWPPRASGIESDDVILRAPEDPQAELFWPLTLIQAPES